MKKITLAVTLVLLCLAGCKKDGSKCYVCSFTSVFTGEKKTETICGSDYPNVTRTDSKGNEMAYTCNQK